MLYCMSTSAVFDIYINIYLLIILNQHESCRHIVILLWQFYLLIYMNKQENLYFNSNTAFL